MSGIFAESPKEPGSISSITLPTGSTMSHQPPGGGPITPMGAGNRGTGSHLFPQPVRSRSGTRILSPPVRLSTSSRPIGAMSPSFPRVASPPQPPPLPPPPPSPQLAPLKARLARSRSVSSHPTSSPLGASGRASQQRWDVPTATSRRAAFGQNQSRSLKESLYDGSGSHELPSSTFLSESAKTAEKIEPVPYSSPSVFLPIAHPRERNIITVCLASFIFLSVSVLIAGLFSTVVLPLCLLACLIRRMGIWSANLYQPVVCCRCNRPQLRASSLNPFVLFFSRLLHQMNDPEHVCQCLFHGSDSHYTSQSLRPLTPAELRWLPAYEYKSVIRDPTFGPSLCSRHSAPLIMICLRFGAPGIELVKLREVIGARLLKGYSASSSLASSPHEPSLGDGRVIEQRQRSCPFVPPADALSRLTQCLTCLSTGYAWRECLAFRLEDHVIHVPATCLPKSEISNLPKAYRPSSSSHPCGARNSGQHAPTIKVDSLVESLSELPLLPNRPLWQAYLLEQYQEFDDSEPSDADSAAETDEAGHPKGRWSGLTVDTGRGHLFTSKRFKPDGSPVTELRPASSASSFVCRRSGSAGIGSLLIFRLHAVLSDDGKALVHLLTNCLTDLPSRAHSPSRVSSNLPCRIDDSRDVSGQLSHRRWRGHYSDGDTNQIHQSGLPAGNSVHSSNNHNMQNEFHAEDAGVSSVTQASSDSHLLQHNPEITAGTITTTPRITVHALPATSNSLCDQSFIQSEDEDPEEKEAAQWWFTFWSSSLATIATFCDLARAILTGPAIILHKYFFTRADMGILVKHKGSNTSTPPSSLATPDSSSHAQRTEKAHSAVYKCMLLSLVKLSRVRQVTKASYSEIILSLLAGALRAYHQSVGLQHPPDLLAFLSVEVPVLPGCPIIQAQHESVQQTAVQRSGALPTTTHWPTHRVPRLWTSAECRQQPEGLAEAGLIGNNNRTVAIAPPRSTTNSLCPGRHVLADICLPINTEGMLPRLWETRQRLIELNNSVDPLCLAWARTILYTLMPHPVAAWLEENHGSSAKASVSVTGVDVVSPFSRLACNSKDQDRGQTYQMPPTRRLAYMSILASKSAEARSLRRRLRKSLPRGASVYPPRLGTSFRALARHLTNANAGLVYVAGSPIVRIDTWMPSPRLSGGPPLPEIMIRPAGSEISMMKWSVCRDLSVAYTTYAGQLSLTLSGTMASECYPNLDLVLHAIKIQLRNMCHLLAGRHVPATADRWLHCGSHLEARNTAIAAVDLSPSLNPNLMLRQDSDSKSVATRSAKPPRPLAPARGVAKRRYTSHSHSHSPEKLPSSTSKGTILEGANRCISRASPTERPPLKPNPNCAFQAGEMGVSDLSFQSTEQLQDRLRAVQQLLSDSAIVSNPPKHCATEGGLASLRAEFSTIIRELKQRCNTTDSVLPQAFDSLLRDNPSQKRTSQHHPDRNSMSQHPMDNISASIYNRIPRRSTEFIMPLVKLTHVKVTSSENTAPQRTHCSFSGGDFDEDPDFYIDGSDEEDDYDDEMVDEETSNPAISNPLAPRPTSSASATAPKGVFGFKHKLNSVLHPHHNKPTRQKEYHFRQKHRRGNRGNANRRRSSLLSTDVGSLDITPNRRGSLGGTTTVPVTGRILYKLAKPKRANALSQMPESVSWTKV